jgi:hypothetical protein
MIRMASRSPSPEYSPLTIGEDLTPVPAYKSASTNSIDFSGLLEPPLQLHEDLKSGCGGQLWPAGMVLAQQMLRYHRNSLKDARMSVLVYLIFQIEKKPPSTNYISLELGAGGGLVGLAVAQGCIIDRPLFITDQLNMVELMRKNITLNGLQSRVVELVLDWYVPKIVS